MRGFLATVLLCVGLASLVFAGVDQQTEEAIRQQWNLRNQYLRALEAKRVQTLVPMAQPAWDDFDVTYYRIQLNLNFDEREIEGAVQVGLRVLRDGLSRVGLDFVTLQMSVDSVGLAAESYSISGDSLYLDLARSYTAGETLRVLVCYHGTPQAHDGFPVLYWQRVADHPAVFSDNEPYYARCWFPCRDYPGDKADSVDMIVRVPKPLVVASNGLLRSVTDNGDGTWTYHWHESYPITTYLVSMQVAAYRTIEDVYVSSAGDTMQLLHFVYPQSYNAAIEDFSVTAPMIQHLAGLWAEYPFLREKYGHAQYNGAWGGMENQTITSIMAGAIRGNHSSDLLVVHELAHQWWGDWISPSDFGHVWLNEGFATFTEALWVEHMYGPDGYQFYIGLTLDAALRQNAPIFRYPGSPMVVYDKGASVLHMLRRMVGDSTFFAILRDYGRRFAYGTATTEDFQQVCEEHTGQDLGWFFQQWIYEPGHPVLSWAWSAVQVAENQYEISGFIDQIQRKGPEVYRLPIEIAVVTPSDSTVHSLWLEDRSLSFSFRTSEPPTRVRLDPRRNLLAEIEQVRTPIVRLVGWDFAEVDGNGDGNWDPGETLELWVSLVNRGLPADAVQLTVEPEGDDLQAERGSVSIPGIAHGDTADNRSEPFRILAQADAESRLAVLWIRVIAGDYTERFRLVIPLGRPNVLYLDDDGGAGTERFYEQAFLSGLVYTHAWDVSTMGLPDTAAADYPVLIWSTGSARESTLTRDEQRVIREHLSRGGAVLVAGSNIGYDLMLNGDHQDSLFYREVLRAELLADSGSFTRLIGKPGDPIGNRMFVYFEGPFGSPEPSSPSVVAPIEPAVGFLFYAGAPSQFGGIRWYDPDTGARLVYLTFGLESIRGPYEDTAGQLLRRCVDWLLNPTAVSVARGKQVPTRLVLHPNYPNPFNPGTTIRFDLPKSGRVRLWVYNLLGQRVRVLREGVLSAGSHVVRWDGRDDSGRDLPTGIYFVELRAEGKVLRQKAVKIR